MQRSTLALTHVSRPGRFAGSDIDCNDDDQGHVELAISKPKGAGCETPTSEPGYSITDQVL